MAPTTWKTYFGEAPEAHSSDDDDYHDGKANGYTRDDAARARPEVVGDQGLRGRAVADTVDQSRP